LVIALYHFCSEPGLRPGANAGLYFNKFVDWGESVGEQAIGSEEKKERKKNWLSRFCEFSFRPSDNLLEEYLNRRRKLAEAKEVECKEVVTRSPFVTGLGLPHPVEASMLWHHTLGVPYLPGSSLKGLVRAWAREEHGEDEDFLKIFGEVGDDEGRVGGVCFMDMLPVGEVKLKLEVMTPHYKWEGEGGVPGDWQEPTPIYYLVVPSKTKFQLCLLPRTPSDRNLLATALEWTLEALRSEGAGAKSFALGYGRFITEEEDASSLKRETPSGRPGETLVWARVLPKRTRTGLLVVELEADGREGVIINSNEVPDDIGPGESLPVESLPVEVKVVPVSPMDRITVRYIQGD